MSLLNSKILVYKDTVMLVTIKVTQDDIEKANRLAKQAPPPNLTHSCPIFLAANKVIPNLEWVGPYGITVRLTNRFTSTIPFPPEVAVWINNWDRDIFVNPIEFEMDIPEADKNAN